MSVDTESAPSPSAEAPKPASAVRAAVTEPVVKAGRDLYDQVAPAVAVYFERLEDLMHEAKASRAAAREKEPPNLADILAGLPDARVLSDKPGRARLRVKALKGQEKLAGELKHALLSVPGVSQVEVNPLTTSVLIVYDAAKYKSLNWLFQTARHNGNHASKKPTSHDQT